MSGKPVPAMTEVSRPYWDAARHGVLQLQRCLPCRTIVHYPRRWCPRCWSTSLEPFDASGKGRVVSFTIVHQGPDASFAADLPYVMAIVQLEEGPTMLANIVGPDAEDVAIGDRVRVRFEHRSVGVVLPQFEKRPPKPAKARKDLGKDLGKDSGKALGKDKGKDLGKARGKANGKERKGGGSRSRKGGRKRR